ncbi:MAG: hypothetical protein HWD61_04410 [Parachlamydiaceae bacterium]|nr:MAG: hypothetical protein HWD61_04410 [Parachlamydiaceae bacterium]
MNILVSPNMKMIKPKLENMYPLANWKWEEKGPDAQHLTNLVYQKFSNGDFSDPKQLELLYLRKTQAEIERESS